MVIIMKLQYKNNLKYNYIFRFLSSFDLSSAIWVLYLIHKGLPLWQIGLMEGIFHVISFLSEIPTGAVADILGRKKALILSRVCHAISAIIMLFASGFWQFVIGFAFSAWGYNLNSGSEEAMVYDSLKMVGKENNYLKISGHLEVILNIAQGIAIFIGGVLAEQSFYYCYGAALFVSVLSLLPCIMLKEPVITKKEETHQISLKKHFIDSYQAIRSNPKVIEILLSYSVIFTIYMIIYFYGQKYFSELGLDKMQISMVMSLTLVLSCIGAMCCNWVESLLKEQTKVYATLVIGLGIIGLTAGNLVLAIVCFSIMGFANTLLYPIQSNALNNLIPSEQRATILSVNSMAYSLFMLILFPIVGGIADKIGLGITFIGLGVIIIISSVGLISRKRIGELFVKSS